MLGHFIKVAIRNIRNKKLFSLLNIAGLSIGIASFLVITLYIYQETSYEQGFEEADRTYRVEKYLFSMKDVAWTGPNLQFMLNEIPEIESYARLTVDYQNEIIRDENYFKTGKTIWSDNNFFEVFDYEIIVGDPVKPLLGPGSAVITRSIAEKVYGSIDVVGEPLEIYKNGTWLISAVVEDPLIKSHLDFDMLMHRQDEEKFSESGWGWIGGYTYVKLIDNVSHEVLDQRLLELTERHLFSKFTDPESGISFEDFMSNTNHVSYSSKPITQIHLNSKLQFEIDAGGDKQALVTLGLIALFILIIASINFMNLTTAKSANRTKEIGIRKVLGTKKKGLVIQFLSESLLLTLIAAILGAGMTEGIIYQVNQELGNVIGISLVKYPVLLINVGLGVLLLGVISGLYPAFYLSSAKVIPLLKGMKLSRVLNLNLAKGLRNGLVVVQFTLSTGLIIGSIFIYNQLLYLQDKDLGFNDSQSFVISNANDLGKNKLAFKNELLRIPGVEAATFTQRVPGDDFNGIHSVLVDDDQRSVVMSTFVADLDLKETLDLEITEGDWFAPELVKTDSNVVLNEAAVRAIGLEDPVGKIFSDYYRVVGVVKDFNYGSYRESISPAIFSYSESGGNRLVIKMNRSTMPVEEVKALWTRFSGDRIATHWVQQNFEQLLEKEDQMANIVAIFTVLAILISCFGLFGLAAFTAEQRLHEFGIRKVLGASVQDIIKIFSLDFMRLIGLAFLISIPLSIWGVNEWLQGYPDRISLNVGVFAIAGLLAIVIAFGTILFQSIKTGRLNPVETIQNE